MKTMKINYYLGFLAVTLGLVLAAGQAKAGTIVSDRGTLNALFVASPVTENFEGLPISDGTATNSSIWNETMLDASTTIEIDNTTYGPGLVSSGVLFEAGAGGHMRWNGNNWFGLPSLTRTIVADGTNKITIDFSANVTAFGVDLINYKQNFFGYRDDTVTVKIFGNDDFTVLDTIAGLNLWADASPVFFGYLDVAGIGKISITGEDHGIGNWSAILDNVTFGTAVPIPGAAWLLGTGLVCLVGFRKTWGKK